MDTCVPIPHGEAPEYIGRGGRMQSCDSDNLIDTPRLKCGCKLNEPLCVDEVGMDPMG